MEWKQTLVLTKDPNATLDYAFDWRAFTNGSGRKNWLAVGESIASYVLTPAAGITVASESLVNSASTVMAFVSGGTVGGTYTLSCKITTNSVPARIEERSISIYIYQQ